jgi:hypothetical protein
MLMWTRLWRCWPCNLIFSKKKSADDTGNTVKPLTLPVSAFHGSHFGKIHPFGYPGFRAIGKRRGFDKGGANAEFPAVNAEPAVFHRFFFFRKALNLPFCCRQYPVFFASHGF